MSWPLPASEAELLRLAKSYPFEAPPTSYLFRGGQARPLAGETGKSAAFRGRLPVIAHGSNRAPAQLRRKFGDGAEIPVTRARLGDYDVVYSAHVTQYGAIAANLHHVPGARADVFVTWLTEAQLARMHETELTGENYAYGRMEGIDLDLDSGPSASLGRAFVYHSTRGCLATPGGPLGLAPTPARARPPWSLHQEAALALVRDRHRPGIALDAFILENIRDKARRRELIARMGEDALAARAPHFRSQ